MPSFVGSRADRSRRGHNGLATNSTAHGLQLACFERRRWNRRPRHRSLLQFFADCNEEEKGGSKQNGRRRRQMRVHGIPSNNKTVQRSKFQMLHCTALSRGRDRIHDFIRSIKTGTRKVSYMVNFLSQTFSISALTSVLPSRNTPCTFIMHCLDAFWRWEKIVWV